MPEEIREIKKGGLQKERKGWNTETGHPTKHKKGKKKGP